MRSDFHSGGTTDCALGDGDGAVRTGVSSWGGARGGGWLRRAQGKGPEHGHWAGSTALTRKPGSPPGLVRG